MMPLPETMLVFGSGLFIGAATCLILCMDKIAQYRLDSDQQRYAASVAKRRFATAEAEVERLTEQSNDLLGCEETSLRKILK